MDVLGMIESDNEGMRARKVLYQVCQLAAKTAVMSGFNVERVGKIDGKVRMAKGCGHVTEADIKYLAEIMSRTKVSEGWDAETRHKAWQLSKLMMEYWDGLIYD